VQTQAVKKEKAPPEAFLAKAAQSVLALYARLQAEQKQEELKADGEANATATRRTDYGTMRLKR